MASWRKQMSRLLHYKLSWYFVTISFHDTLSWYVVMIRCHDILSWYVVMIHCYDTLSIVKMRCYDTLPRYVVMICSHGKFSWYFVMKRCHDMISWNIIMICCHDTLSWYVVTIRCQLSWYVFKVFKAPPCNGKSQWAYYENILFFLKLENVYLGLIAIVYLQFLLSGRENGVTFSHVRFTCVSPITWYDRLCVLVWTALC